MRKLKRKPSPQKLNTPHKKGRMNTLELVQISPSSRITVFKLDIVSCNGKPLNSIELSSADLEFIWTDSLLREAAEISGYTSFKTKNNTEIRAQYQLKQPMSIRDIAFEAEFNHERVGPRGVEILRCRVVGLGDVRPAKLGERVKATLLVSNFDITPDQLIAWMSRFGKIHDGHR
jgi:hypothetical protein